METSDIKKPFGVIYRVTNLLNNKIYIGQSKNFNRRYRDHLKACSLKKDNAAYFHRAINYHGPDSFLWEIVDSASCLHDLNTKESEWILKTGSIAPNGYNCNYGGNNHTFSEVSREKQSRSQKKRFENIEQRQLRAKQQSAVTKLLWDHPEYVRNKKANRYKSIDDILLIAKKYEYLSDFRKNNNSAYIVANRNGWMTDIKKIFKTQKYSAWNIGLPAGSCKFHSDNEVHIVLQKIDKWSDFRIKHSGLYEWAERNMSITDLKANFKKKVYNGAA